MLLKTDLFAWFYRNRAEKRSKAKGRSKQRRQHSTSIIENLENRTLLTVVDPIPSLDVAADVVGSASLDGAEISAYDATSQRLYVTAGTGLQVIDIGDPSAPVQIALLDPQDFGADSSEVTSVTVDDNGLIAISVPSATDGAPGSVLFFDGSLIGATATLISQESFEAAPGTGYTLNGAFDAGFDYFGQFAAPDNGNAARDDFQSGFDGSFAIHGQDHDGQGGSATATVSVDGVDISGQSNLNLTLAIGALNSEPSFENYEAADGDGIRIFATIDGGTRTLIAEFAPEDDASDLLLDTNEDGVGDATRLTTDLRDFSFSIDGTGSSLDIDVEMTSTGSFEPLVIDNVRVFGGETPSPLVNSVTVGALPDMLTFTPDGNSVLVANEGEPLDLQAMATGSAGFNVTPIFTVGQTFSGTSGALNPTTAGDYTPPGVLDGLGAIELDSDTVRVFASHELLSFRGYDYEISDGAGGTFTLDGARISYFDIDKTTREITDAGIAFNVVYDANGNVASDASFLANNLAGFSRFCSAFLAEAHEFGGGRGLEDAIYFAGEEDGGNFNVVGGAVWALDVSTGNLWHVPDFGRGAWENITEIDTGTTTHVAFILADDSSPFDADDPDGFGPAAGDGTNEAAPLYLYVGEKDGGGDFLAQNGLRGGTLYVWVSDTGELDPLTFNGFETTPDTLAGTWMPVDMTLNLGQASETGDNGFDEFGYPTQRNLWLQAEAAGAFGFSRPEDVATNPNNGTQVVLASTGADDFAVDEASGNGIDSFGTLYTVTTDFTDINAPTASISILYDGDVDTTRAIRSPDNLDWADDGFIYVQEDEAEEDTLSGDEVLFGDGAVNPNEAGIVRVDPADGATERVATIDRGVNLDFSIDFPTAAVDTDAGRAGEWETSGILDVSTLFGEAAGTLFLFDIQAHGIEDQDNFNAGSRINDSDLVEGGQLAFLSADGVSVPDAGLIDPAGSVSIIDVSAGAENATVTTADFTAFDGQEDSLRTDGVRIFPGRSASEDFEPEYIAVSPDGSQAFVTLQENNAVAVLDLGTNMISDVLPLGLKDHTLTGNRLDASDRDDTFNLQNYPVLGMYMPDAIASYEVAGTTYFVTANEGDARDEDDRLDDATLDPTAFPNAAALQEDEVLGRLEYSTIDGDTDGDGDLDQIQIYGARSFSIYDTAGNQVFDSGDVLAQALNDAGLYPDGRSDAKGSEPEGVTIGSVGGRTYAFVGLERANTVAVFDVSDPTNVTLTTLLSNEGDERPEGLTFIDAANSPTGESLLAVTNENEDNPTLTIYSLAEAIPPSFDETGPFSVAVGADPGSEVGQVEATDEVGTVTYAITGGNTDDGSMALGLDGFGVTPLFTVGEVFNGTTGALNSFSVGDYQPVGILDGIGGFELDENTVRVFVNHELVAGVGSEYQVSDGAGGSVTLRGARISYFDIDKESRLIVDSGLAFGEIRDRAGNVVTDPNQLDFGALQRLCSGSLFHGDTFGAGNGLVDDIFFTGEESNGGTEYALDVANGVLHSVPALGRAGWENVTLLDTGNTTHVAVLIGDDRAGAPLYLFIGEKDAVGDNSFLDRNGLAQGRLFVWASNGSETDPSNFNGTLNGLFNPLAGTWNEVDIFDAGLADTTGFDALGYADQATQDQLADDAGHFAFSRPEDLATDPNNGTRAVLASTGRGSLFPDDDFGTLYLIDVDFTDINNPTGALTIIYDGDLAGNQDFGLRSPDNLDWGDDGQIYVQEDRSTSNATFGGESGEEASIFQVDPSTGAATRIAQVNRAAVLPLGASDNDPDDLGDWETSGILDVSTLFGEAPGSLFIFDVQAHSVRDGVIGDAELVQGGQLSLLERNAESGAFRINENTGVITVGNPAALEAGTTETLTVQAFDGVNSSFATVDVNVNEAVAPTASTIKFATFNGSLNRSEDGELRSDLATGDDTQAQRIAEIIQRTDADVILINEFDFDANGIGIDNFRQNYLEVGQNGADPVYYPFVFNAPSNTGIESDLDLDNNGSVGGGNDAFGFGTFEGQFGMVLLSRYEIVESDVRTFQQFLWRDMPNNSLPADPTDSDGNGDFENFYTTEELDALRLSSKSHWDIPIDLGDGEVVHVLAAHPTPPVFDGPEDRNGRRNHDEIRFFSDYVTPGAGDYIYDDAEFAAAGNTTPGSPTGGLAEGESFVILGDYNADPNDGDSFNNAARQFTENPLINTTVTPSSAGGPEDAAADGADNESHTGDPAFDTSDFSEPPGNLRVDYALPSADLEIVNASVFWPAVGEDGADLVSASDHRLVSVEITNPAAATAEELEELQDGNLNVSPIGTVELSGAEISAYDADSQTLIVTGGSLQFVDISDPANPTLINTIDLVETFGLPSDEVTSVAVNNGLVAASVSAEVSGDDDSIADPGRVLLFTTSGALIRSVTVGALPDMVTFTPDGNTILVANEGEPGETVDPVGSVSLIDVSGIDLTVPGFGANSVSVQTAGFTAFDGTEDALRTAGVRIFPDATFSVDVEPEYIAVAPDGATAFVTLQEANAVAVLDISTATITEIQPLGLKDHSVEGNGLDSSDRDGGINIQTRPVFGMLMPDAIATFEDATGKVFYITANEGDARDEDDRIKDATLDPTAFPNAAELQRDDVLGRLQYSTIDGDTDGDGDIDVLHVYGGRSFSIFSADGTLVFDSGDQFEQLTAQFVPELFNSEDGDPAEFDGRSDNKGPEPEGVTVGVFGDRTLAFIGLERTGGVMVYDVTDPAAPEFLRYATNPGDVSPEGLVIIPGVVSPGAEPLLAVTNEDSNSLSLFSVIDTSTFSLQVLHASDLEGGVDAIGDAPNFAAVVDALEEDAAVTGSASILLSAGDNFLSGPFFSASGDFDVRDDLQAAYQTLFDETGLTNIREAGGRVDVSIMNIIGFDASAIGNHEFDLGSNTFAELIGTDIRGDALSDVRWLGAQFPYLSANLDFSNDDDLSGLFTADILPNTAFASTPDDLDAAAAAPKLAPATTIEVHGETIGVVGATTQLLESISSPGDTVGTAGTTNDMQAMADVLNPIVADILDGNDDTPGTADDVNKVILVSHLQQIALETELIGLLNGVDIVIAGGSDTLLADESDTLRTGDTADDTYPVVTQNADADPAVIVSTDGEYSYVGRLVIDFDRNGVLITDSLDTAVSGAYATDEAGVLAVTGASDLASAISASARATEVQELTDAVSGIVTSKDGQVFGSSDVFLEGRRSAVRTEETNLGNLTADANLAAAQAIDSMVLVSLKNGGGIRAEIGSIDGNGNLLPTEANPTSGKQAGEISQLDIENTLRFNNELTLLTLTATELELILEHGVAATADGATPGQFPQVGGISFSFDPSQAAVQFDEAGNVLTDGQRIRTASIVDANGNVIDNLVQNGIVVGDPDREIRIVTLNFLAGGGDGYPFDVFGSGVSDTGIGEQTALADFLTANFSGGNAPFNAADTSADQDLRIQNLSQRSDTVPTDPFSVLSIADLADQTIAADAGALTIKVIASLDTASLTTSTLPDFASFADNGDGTGLFTFNPSIEDIGTTSITITASSETGIDTETFSLEVVAPESVQTDTATRINAGGGTVGDFLSDRSFNTGSTFSTGAAINTAATPGVPASVFQTTRWDPASGPELTYSVPVTPGDYTVNLYFAEIYGPAATIGGRVFDVSIEDSLVLDDFDVFVAAGGGNRSIVQTFNVTSDETLDIDFAHVVENPMVMAIEILGTETTTNTGPTVASIGDSTITEGDTTTISVSASDVDGDAITLQAGTLPDFVSFTDNGNGTGEFVVASSDGDIGVFPLTVSATSGSPGLTSQQSFLLTVNDDESGGGNNGGGEEPNTAPVLSAISDVVIDAGSSTTVSINATDADADSITLSATGLPGFANLTDNGDGTGTISVDADESDSGVFSITVQAGDGTDTTTTAFTLTVNAAAPVLPDVVRINAGGDQVAGDPLFEPDDAFQNGVGIDFETGASIDTSSETIPEGTPASIFNTVSYDNPGGPELGFDVENVVGTQYEVRLFFSEIWTGAFSTGARVFDVSIDGNVVLDNYDIFARAGGANRGIVETFTVTGDGNLDIDLGHIVQNPAIAGIEMRRIDEAFSEDSGLGLD